MFAMTCYEGIRITRTIFNGSNERFGLDVFMRRHPDATHFEVHRVAFDDDGFLVIGQIVESVNIPEGAPPHGVTIDIKQKWTAKEIMDREA